VISLIVEYIIVLAVIAIIIAFMFPMLRVKIADWGNEVLSVSPTPGSVATPAPTVKPEPAVDPVHFNPQILVWILISVVLVAIIVFVSYRVVNRFPVYRKIWMDRNHLETTLTSQVIALSEMAKDIEMLSLETTPLEYKQTMDLFEKTRKASEAHMIALSGYHIAFWSSQVESPASILTAIEESKITGESIESLYATLKKYNVITA
jgi:magnesium-transporting ATPase (P-type)